ncbi:MAG: hypothetical protein A4E32_01390 [Methanomassiliicoccales archaeon PtaU1.Bin124]|nr:MAG: hypothetical protein A4E32_01390 [Methanomassiliicoccales archaeon PtaU1.Bin124]
MIIEGNTVLYGSLKIGIGFGLVGGIVGTILMDMVMMITFVIAGQPADIFFTAVGEKFGDGALVGLAIHNLIGLTGGLVFSLSVLSIEALQIDSVRKGLKLGLAAGAVTIPLGCIPLAIWLGEPILVVVAFSMIPHLVWGTVVGWTLGYGLLSYEHKIEKRTRSEG